MTAAVLAEARPAWLADVADVQADAARELAGLRADFPAWVIELDGGNAVAGLGIAARPRLAPALAPVCAATAAGMREALDTIERPPCPVLAPVGTVYLLHFSAPVGNTASRTGYARHYTGWSAFLDFRLELHRAGRSGVPLVRAAVAAGITLELARIWPDVTRARERQLKRQGSAARYCPLCGIRPRGGAS
jgi:hypothetical protein